MEASSHYFPLVPGVTVLLGWSIPVSPWDQGWVIPLSSRKIRSFLLWDLWHNHFKFLLKIYLVKDASLSNSEAPVPTMMLLFSFCLWVLSNTLHLYSPLSSEKRSFVLHIITLNMTPPFPKPQRSLLPLWALSISHSFTGKYSLFTSACR